MKKIYSFFKRLTQKKEKPKQTIVLDYTEEEKYLGI